MPEEQKNQGSQPNSSPQTGRDGSEKIDLGYKSGQLNERKIPDFEYTPPPPPPPKREEK